MSSNADTTRPAEATPPGPTTPSSTATSSGSTATASNRTAIAASAPVLRSRSPRVAQLEALLQKRMGCRQRDWSVDTGLFAEPGFADEPTAVRRANAVALLLERMPIAIEADDLIVGHSLQGGVVVRPELPDYFSDTERAQANRDGTTLSTGLSHKTPDYPRVMDTGLAWVLGDISDRAARTAALPASPEQERSRAWHRAMEIECKAAIALAGRFGDLAERQATDCVDPRRADELQRIAEVCRRVPERPPRSFHEAVQAFWFVHFALFSSGTRLSCGRIDQYLEPFLSADLDAGAITLEEAQELVDCLWLRFNDRAQIERDNFYDPEADHTPRRWAAGHRSRSAFATDAADAINHFGQNILLSGIRPDGSDGTNPLSYLMLNSLEKFAFTSPVVTVRLHAQSPPELLTRSAEVLKSGGGMPYIDNDDVIIPAYEALGVPTEDARDYANSNCWETMIAGASDQELIRGCNFLLFLELALNRGTSMAHGPMGPDTGDPRSFISFDQLVEAWQRQADHQLQCAIDHIGSGAITDTLEHSGHGRFSSNGLVSVLTRDCIARGRDVTHGGARYLIWHVMGEAVANAIDAMAAIEQAVFDEQSISMNELLTALAADWVGFESLRARLVAQTPKYANNDTAADAIGRRLMRFFVERSRHHAARYPDIIFPCSVGTFSWYAMIGKEVAASADGRRNGEPIAANFSPAPGADRNGPTAAVNSYVSMPVGDLAAGAPLDLRFSAAGLRGDAGTKRLAGLIRAFIGMGGNMLTATVTDATELRRAMEEPERYRHLRVRMGGWSAYFVMLSREQQLLHISRVEHGMVYRPAPASRSARCETFRSAAKLARVAPPG